MFRPKDIRTWWTSQHYHRPSGVEIYVTHDQVEAMTMADRIVVLKDGEIQQVGTPMDL